MKKHYLFKFILIMIPFSAFLLMSSSTGRDDGRTGSPGDLSITCASCHSGGSFGASISITTDIPSGGYQTSTQYEISVNISSSASAHGFQLAAERTSDDAKVGTFTAGTGSRVTNSRITHSNPNQNSWSFQWTSPSTDQGAVKFYAAGNAANGDGETSGDQIATTSTSAFTVLGVYREMQLDFAMYPNPSSAYLTIQLPTEISKAEVNVYDLTGRLLKTAAITSELQTIDVQHLSTGIYVLQIHADGKIGTRQFIKK